MRVMFEHWLHARPRHRTWVDWLLDLWAVTMVLRLVLRLF